MDNLPNEIRAEVFCFLDPNSLVQASKVCNLWKRIIFSGDHIWKSIYFQLDCLSKNCYCKRFHLLHLQSSSESKASTIITATQSFMQKVLNREWIRYNHSPWYDTRFPPPNRPMIFIPLQITESFVSGILPEYSREAFVLPQNLSRRRFRSIARIVRVGIAKVVILTDQSTTADSETLLEVTARNDVCSPLEEDNPELIQARDADKRLRAVCAKCFFRLDVLYSILWKAVRLNNVTPQSIHGMLQMVASREEEIVPGLEELPPSVYKELIWSASGVLRKTISLFFGNSLGIDGVKQVLKKAQVSTLDSENSVKVSYVAAPYYDIVIKARKQQTAKHLMSQILSIIEAEAKVLGGEFSAVDHTTGNFQID